MWLAWIIAAPLCCARSGRVADRTRLSNLPPCLIGTEACVGAHHFSRKLEALGHDARVMQRGMYSCTQKGRKNDFRDAEAIAEAWQRSITCANDWSVNASVLSIKFAPSCWGAAWPLDRGCGSCALSCRAF
jgi:hypothetical protein